MVFHQVIAGFHALFNVIGLPGNLLVIVTIALERRFHVMRYILLASLAVSDFLCLILTNSFRIGSIAQERWLYGQTMCHLNPFFVRYFYFNTVLHLMAVSYERYSAIVKSPMTYDGTITKSRVVLIALIWIVPIPFSIGPFLGWGNYVYNPEVFFCEQGWSVSLNARNIVFLALTFFVLPFLVIVSLNWKVFKTARVLQRNVAPTAQVETRNRSESQLQDLTRIIREHKAAVDVGIIIGAFLLCFLPGWITGLCRQFVNSMKVPAEAILSTSCIFFVSSLSNPIIYSVRKEEFRSGVKKMLRRMGLAGSSIDIDEGERHANNPASLSRLRTRSTSTAQQNSSHIIGAEDIVEA